ncbi:hypothetical protein LTR78_010445 [Recurvomyces mirabilis]|uniref:Uncharacterized protein n=1 Tax=Recurvomyces mirabilis TaxID=574656 RepID=A0AAE0TQG9_9PEZI|nr:hypothetical protein LTR78_010445 [Recurvomyces mirabilis]KAK5150524.1 hypothetical protein LTS14_010017 [Recurvomyces mirabilis]
MREWLDNRPVTFLPTALNSPKVKKEAYTLQELLISPGMLKKRRGMRHLEDNTMTRNARE